MKPQTLARLVCLALVLSVLIVTLVKEISRSHDSYSLEPATRETYTTADRFTGYVFRDEIAATTANNGPIRYLVREGDTVSSGNVLAEVFRDDTGTDKRERAAAIYAEIDALQAALDAQDNWRNLYLLNYPEMMRALSTQSYASGVSCTDELADVLTAKESEKAQSAATVRERIEALQAQLDEMIKHTNDPVPVLAATDGVFYSATDGYEAVFGTKTAADLTPEGLRTLLEAAPDPIESVGKLVSQSTWFLAIPTTRDIANTYSDSQSYVLYFEDGALSMTLDRITPAADGEEALLLFRADAMPTWLSLSRAQSVRVEREQVTGLSIPAHALIEGNAVYILQDGVARLRCVTPLQTAQGCVLVSIENKDGYLREGDTVIVSTRQLFDGKVLK